MFRKHDEGMQLRSAEHMHDKAELKSLAKEGRLELEQLFEQDSKNSVSS